MLLEVIRELKHAYRNMLNDMQRIIANALLPDIKDELPLTKMREKACARYETLFNHTADVQGLRPFIKTLSNKEGDDENWLQRVLMFLAGKATKNWTDIDRDGAVFKLSKLSKRLIDLQILQSHYLKKVSLFSEDFDVFLLRSMRHGYKDYDEIITIDKEQKKYIAETKEKISFLLGDLRDDNARLSVIAEIVDTLLTKKNKKGENSNQIRAIND